MKKQLDFEAIITFYLSLISWEILLESSSDDYQYEIDRVRNSLFDYSISPDSLERLGSYLVQISGDTEGFVTCLANLDGIISISEATFDLNGIKEFYYSQERFMNEESNAFVFIYHPAGVNRILVITDERKIASLTPKYPIYLESE